MAGEARRRKLIEFDCTHSRLGHGCFADDGACGWQERCPDVVIYREYLKLQKCARLLRVFMWWIERWKTWTSYGRRVRQGDEIEAAIRKALKEAGL